MKIKIEDMWNTFEIEIIFIWIYEMWHGNVYLKIKYFIIISYSMYFKPITLQ